MTATDDRRQQSAALHNKLRGIFQDAERLAHDAVQADDNAQALVADLEATTDQHRKEIERLMAALRTADEQVDDLVQECDDLRAANYAYASILSDVRRVLGGEDDADLVEVARALTAEVKRLITQDILKRERAERAEAECERRDAILQIALAYQDYAEVLDPTPAQSRTKSQLRASLFDRLREWRKEHVPRP